jgi:DNA-binding beta-propeller fold protein YncE
MHLRDSLVLTASFFTGFQFVSSSARAQDTDGAIRPQTVHYSDVRRVDARAGSIEAQTNFSSSITINSDPDGDVPHELAFLPNGSAVVIVHKDTDNLTFFDVNTRTVTNTVAIGHFPVQVAVTPNGQYALAPAVLSNALSVVDVATHTLVANVPISGQQPYKALVTSDSHWAVVGVIDDAVNSHFSIVDLTTLAEVATIPTSEQGVIGSWFTPEAGSSGVLFTRFALSPNGTTILLPDRNSAVVRVYDRASASLVTSITTAANPSAVDISSDGTTAVVSHEFGIKRVSKIDLGTLTLTASFTTASDLTDELIRITPDKSHAICAISNNVIFVDLTSGTTDATLATGVVGDIEFSFNNQYAFVSNFNSSVIDLASRTIVKSLTLAPAAEAVTSPTSLRAVALNNRFSEDVQVYNINGSSGFVEGFASTGAPPEGDAPRSIAVSADGRLAVTGNDTSRNVSVVDLVGGFTRSWIPTGTRPLGVAITPDSTRAVVCNGDSDTVSIINLSSDMVEKTLAIASRPAEVRISPDSQTAYVTTVAGSDTIWFIHLAGASSSIVGSLLAGQMGSAQAYAYSAFSSMELSPDGSILAVCYSFDDRLCLIDTATRTEIVRVPTGDFPYRVAWKPDGTRAYTINTSQTAGLGDEVSVIAINGAASSLVTNILVAEYPSTIDVDASGSFVYVGNSGTNPGVRVISTATNTVVQTILLAGNSIRSSHLSGNVLYVAAGTTSGGNLIRIAANGASSSMIDTTPLSASPCEMGFSASIHEAVIAQPIPDSVDIRRFDETSTYCIGAPNSAGPGASIGYTGTTSVSIDDFTLTVSGAIPNKAGFFIYGNAQTQIPLGDGFRCVGGTLFRLRPATNANASGMNTRFVNFTVSPAGSGPGQITPASTWNFQYWYRDPLGPGGSGVNLSNALEATFTP